MWNPLGQIIQPGALGAFSPPAATPAATTAPNATQGWRAGRPDWRNSMFQGLQGLGIGGPMAGAADPNSFQAAMHAWRGQKPGMGNPLLSLQGLQGGALNGFMPDWQQQMQQWQTAMGDWRAGRPDRGSF